MFFNLILCAVVLSVLYHYFTRTFNYWRRKNIKGPKPVPFFGNYKDVALRKKHLGMFYYDMYKQYPDEKIIGLYRMTSPTLLIRDLDIAKQVLVKDFEAFPDRGTYFSKEGLGENIFHADSKTWKLVRNRFTPVFTSTKIKGIFHQLINCGDNFVDYIESVTMKRSEQDVYQLALKYSVGTTMVGVFGLNIDTYNDDKLCEFIDKQFDNSHCNELDMLFSGILTKLNLSIFSKEIIKFCHQIVEIGKYKKSLISSGTNNAIDVFMNLNKEGAIYTAKKTIDHNSQPLNISDDLLAAQTLIFYIAGYGNSSLLLTYVMYHLAFYPEVQEKLREEINKIIESHNGQLTYEALNEMKYLDMVFEETLRLHPLTNGLVRGVARDIKLEGTDLTLSKGSIVVVSPYSVQHDEKYFPDPERFNPDRFLPENVKERHPLTILSFGHGPRSCLGKLLGRVQFGIGIVKVLQKFRIETTKNTITSIKYSARRLLLSPDEKIYLKFVPY